MLAHHDLLKRKNSYAALKDNRSLQLFERRLNLSRQICTVLQARNSVLSNECLKKRRFTSKNIRRSLFTYLSKADKTKRDQACAKQHLRECNMDKFPAYFRKVNSPEPNCSKIVAGTSRHGTVNRHYYSDAESRKKLQESEKSYQLLNRKKAWLSVIYLIKPLNFIRNIYEFKTQNDLHLAQIQEAAIALQLWFQHHFGQHTNYSKKLFLFSSSDTRAQINLSYNFRARLRLLLINEKAKIILKERENSIEAILCLLRRPAAKFRKSLVLLKQKVITVQRAVREYLINNRKDLHVLIDSFNQIIPVIEAQLKAFNDRNYSTMSHLSRYTMNTLTKLSVIQSNCNSLQVKIWLNALRSKETQLHAYSKHSSVISKVGRHVEKYLIDNSIKLNILSVFALKKRHQHARSEVPLAVNTKLVLSTLDATKFLRGEENALTLHMSKVTLQTLLTDISALKHRRPFNLIASTTISDAIDLYFQCIESTPAYVESQRYEQGSSKSTGNSQKHSNFRQSENNRKYSLQEREHGLKNNPYHNLRTRDQLQPYLNDRNDFGGVRYNPNRDEAYVPHKPDLPRSTKSINRKRYG